MSRTTSTPSASPSTPTLPLPPTPPTPTAAALAPMGNGPTHRIDADPSQHFASAMSLSSLSSPSSSPAPAPSPAASRATSPSLRPFRLASSPDTRSRPTSPTDFFTTRIRRPSTTHGRPAPKDSLDSDASHASSFGFDADPFAAHYGPTTPPASPPPPLPPPARPSTSDGTRRARGSLLVAAGDALALTFARRRRPARPPAAPPRPAALLPEVIEISAARADDEVEERERLRDAAALSIGIAPALLQDAPADEPEDADTRTENARSAHASSVSVAAASAAHAPLRSRASLRSHSRANSAAAVAAIPPFPTTRAGVEAVAQLAGTLPKYYAPGALRMFARARHWRSRWMVLSSPGGGGAGASFLHLFKSGAGDEREVERLEINEESMVFVAEEDVAGRRHVVKVGGIEVGSARKEEDGGRTMWFLQIVDPAESQRWIAAIKTCILGQRSMRAGLGMPTLGGIEPRGDMDVMLSMRAQGMIAAPAPTKPLAELTATRAAQAAASDAPASSVSTHSVRSLTTGTKPPPPPGAVSTLKGLFSSGRPRSSSRATSIASADDAHDDSFASRGSNLLSMLRPTDAPAHTGRPKAHTIATALPFAGPAPERRLDRKIVPDRPPHDWAAFDVMKPRPPPTPVTPPAAPSASAPSLQPAPRKRWSSFGAAPPTPPHPVYHSPTANTSTAGSFGTGTGDPPVGLPPPASPALSGNSFGTPDARPRASSIQSVSTFASGDAPLERSSSSTKRSSRRWSRQGTLPTRLTPPAGPPPPAPPAQVSSRLQTAYAPDDTPSRPGSAASSERSVVSGLPMFSKRASASSSRSVGTTSSASHAHAHGTVTARPISAHRASMPPPPRPAPTFALPPAPAPLAASPDQEPPASVPDSPPPARSSFRDAVAARAFRLSLIAPKPPPSSVLPPRPDDPEFLPRTSTSAPDPRAPPAPPPSAPLPAPPPARHTSIKQRLRILSAPSGSLAPSTHTPASPASPTPTATHPRPMSVQVAAAAAATASPPHTPIGEYITPPWLQNDPSFLQLASPLPPATPLPPPRPPRSLPTPPEPAYPELISLSPPPRRGSRQISIYDRGEREHDRDSEGSDVIPAEESKPLSLSRRGSVISLGIVSM